jgi:hypothetical protein
MGVKLIAISRAQQQLSFEHDGVRFDWTGSGALAIIALVEHMMQQQEQQQRQHLPIDIEWAGAIVRECRASGT